MKKHIIAILSLIFIVISPHMTLAHGEEDDGHDIQEVMKKFQEDNINKKTQQESNLNTEEGSHPEDAHHSKDSDHVGSKHEEANLGESTHDEEHKDDGGHAHGDKEYVDMPPNYKILGSVATISLVFILLGIWNKWLRRNK